MRLNWVMYDERRRREKCIFRREKQRRSEILLLAQTARGLISNFRHIIYWTLRTVIVGKLELLAVGPKAHIYIAMLDLGFKSFFGKLYITEHF